MAVGVTGGDTPLTAMRAVVRIESAEVADSAFKDQKDRSQKQFACSLKALSGAGERDGESFNEWFSFLATGEIGRNTKTGQVVVAALGEDAAAETLEELAGKLVGKRFVCQIGTSRNGQYSRVQHDTVNAAPPEETNGGSVGRSSGPDEGGLRGAQQQASEAANTADAPEWESIPF